MATHCPKCLREFDDAGGYCPFDGARLTPLQDLTKTLQDADNLAITLRGDPDTLLPVTTPGGVSPVSLIARLARAEVRTGDDANDQDFLSLRDMPSTTAAMRALDIDESVNPYEYLVGTTLDQRYAVERIVGEGAMGVVFLARHVHLDKPMAIKVLKREAAIEKDVVARFLREARAASSIGHPNIVEFTDFGTTPDGLTYSVMEFVGGPTLDRLLATGVPVPIPRALDIAGKLAEALAVAHAKNVIHRDLKPDNIFVHDTGAGVQVKVVDFGIAKVLEAGRTARQSRITADNMVFGTPEYMAPEQASGRPDIDHRVDVYSLGIILYQMLTGVVPHKSDNMMRTLAMRMLDPIAPISEIRPDRFGDRSIYGDLEALVADALATNPSERVPDMDEFLARLQALPTALTGPSHARRSEPALAAPSGEIGFGEPGDDVVTTPYLGRVDELMAAYPGFKLRRQDEQGGPSDPPAPVQPVAEPAPSASSARRFASILALLLAALAGGVVGFLLFRGGDSGDSRSGANPQGTSLPASDSADTPVVTRRDAGVDARPGGLSSALVPDGSDLSSGTAVAPVVHDTAEHRAATSVRTSTRSSRRRDGTGGRKGDADKSGHSPGSSQPARARIGRSRSIKVLSEPAHASLYVDHNYSGTGGTTFERPEGTIMTVECRLNGYKTGRVEVRFDGGTEVYICHARRIPKCVDGVKNPYDDCPD